MTEAERIERAKDAIRACRMRMANAHDSPDPETEPEYDGFLARAAISAYLGGGVVVPREPTLGMGEAGIASLGEDDDRAAPTLVWDIYRAMISAAPHGIEG